MRIACVHIPQFALQSVTRVDPSLRGAAVAVVGAGIDPIAGTVARVALHSPVVLACSRAAWALGVRIGMTATAARSISPALSVVSADASTERDTARAIADALLGLSPTVDLGGRVGPAGAHLALYCEVPAKTRGQTFGERIGERLAALGLTGRIGIADDRFTAWVAASQAGDDESIVSVPRGGSAAFLAPRPLSLLPITPEVQHMLESLGVTTLGQFAKLPPPSVHLSGGPSRLRARPLEADFQALARGDSGHTLDAYSPDGAIAEQATISPALSPAAAIALVAERLALRLAGRGRAAIRLELHVTASGGTARDVAIDLLSLRSRDPGSIYLVDVARKPIDAAEDLADLVGKALHDDLAALSRLRVTIAAEALPGDAVDAVDAEAHAPAAIEHVPAQVAMGAVVDPIGVVLSNTGLGTGLGNWQLTPPSLRDERRDAHRRTQRGKDRRHQPRGSSRAAESALVQPRLFKTLV